MKAYLRLSLAVLRLYLRDPLSVALSLALIVFMMVLFGLVMGDDQFQIRLPLAVLDEAGNPASRQLVSRIGGDDLLEVRRVESEAGAVELLRRAQVIGGLVLERPFTGRPGADGRLGGLRLILDDHSTRWIQLGTQRLQRIVGPLAGRQDGELWTTSVRPIDVVKSRYIDFIFPGLLAMSIMQACLASGLVLLDARELGVLRRLRLTPLGSLSIFGGFMTGRLLIVGLHLGVLTLVALFGFQARILASPLELVIVLLIGTTTFMALGVMVATIAPSIESASLITQMVSLPMSFLSGVFFKVESMPTFLKWFAKVLPLTYLVDVIRGTVGLGVPLTHFMPQLAALLAWLVACFAVCALGYRRWQSERS